ncbi:MAG: hypothetical protein ABL962_18215 [Fimbriimonadaceae bacterium]
MRKLVAALALGAVLATVAVGQSDHNNIDAGRPLRFDDASSIAFRERALEIGLSLSSFRRTAPTYGLRAEYKVGFAKNQDIGITFAPRIGGGDRRFDPGNVEIAYFNAMRREIEDSPALAYRVELGLPTGRGSRGVDAKLRGIATRALGQYDKLHINLDIDVASNPKPDERNVAFGAILGYSSPIGYPRRFDQTIVAEFAVQQSRRRGLGFSGTLGVGLRQQLGPHTVFDVGLESDIFGPRGVERSPLKLTIGYSIGF